VEVRNWREIQGECIGSRMLMESFWKKTAAEVSGECRMRQGRRLNIFEPVICQA